MNFRQTFCFGKGYIPLNMHKHSVRLFRESIYFTLEPSWPQLSIIMIRILDFVSYNKKDEFMSVKIRHTLVRNPITR